MGERGFFSALSGVLFLALSAYAAARFYDGACGDVTAVLTTVHITESLTLDGIALRQEQTVSLSEDFALIPDGSRVSAGTVLGSCRGGDVLAPCSGVWFSRCDGLETLSPDCFFPDGSMPETDPATVGQLLSRRAGLSRSCGRLVTDHVWYYAALCPDSGSVPSTGDCELFFEGMADAISARLIYVSPPEDSQRALLFRLTAGGSECLSLRRCRARLPVSDHCGLAAPPEAVYTDASGNTFVSCITADGIHGVPAQILYTEKDRVLLSSPELRDGSRILVRQQVNDGYSP